MKYGVSFLDRDFKKKDGFKQIYRTFEKIRIYTARITADANIQKDRRKEEMGKAMIPEGLYAV